MKRLVVLIFLSIIPYSYPASSQPAEFIVVGKDASAFHEDLFRNQRIKVEPPAVIDVEIFVELIGIPNAAKINGLGLQIRRSLGLSNAFAVFHNGFRSIVYDPNWAASATAEFYLALGHEAGHHFCEHTIGKARNNPRETELEADRFAGASVKRFEVYHNRSFIREVMAAAYSKYPESGSPSYPPRVLRLEAIKKGYEEGSPCGGLAPPVRGLSRGSR